MKNLTQMLLFFAVFITVGPSALRCEERKWLTIHVDSADNIKVPVDGYFQTESLYFYDISVPDPIAERVGYYTAWDPKGKRALPLFGDIHGGNFSARTKFALLYNRRCFEAVMSNLMAAGSWSASGTRALSAMGEFGVPATTTAIMQPGHLHSTGFDLNAYFNGRQHIPNQLATLDLTYSRLGCASYEILGQMRSIEKLALPMHGSVLKEENFIENPFVKELVVWNTEFSRRDLLRLAQFKSLKRLVFNGCTLNFSPGQATIASAVGNGKAGADDPLEIFRGQIENLTLVNCDRHFLDLIAIHPWANLQEFEGDAYPDSLTRTFPSLRFLSIFVAEAHVNDFTDGRASPYWSLAQWCSPNPPVFRWKKSQK